MPQVGGKSTVSFFPRADGKGKRITVHFYYDKQTKQVGKSASTAFPTWSAVASAVKRKQLFLGKDPKDEEGRLKYQAVRKLLDDLINKGPPSQEDMKSDDEDEKQQEAAPPQQVKENLDAYKTLPDDLSNFQVPTDSYNLPPDTLPAGNVFVAPLPEDDDANDEETLDEKNYNQQLKTLQEEADDKKEGEQKDNQWVDYTFKHDKTEKVWKEWQTLANKKTTTFVQLMKKINSQLDVVDHEMRQWATTKNNTFGARSNSFLAALKTHLKVQGVAQESIDTDKADSLLHFAITNYWESLKEDGQTSQKFNNLVETLANCTEQQREEKKHGNGIVFHIKQFKFSQEIQLLGEIRRNSLWPLIQEEGKQYTGHTKFEDAKKVYPLYLLQMSEIRHLAHKTLKKNKSEWEQSHPLTFVSDKVIAFKNKLIESSSIHDKILLVILCVGSRWIEVVKMSDFYVAADTDWKDAANQKESTYFGNDATRDIVVRGVAKARKQTEGLLRYVDQDTIEEKNPEFNFDRENRYLPPKPVLFLTVKQIQYLVYVHIRPFIENYCQTKLGQSLKDVSPAQLAQALNRKTNDRLKRFDLTINHQRDSKRLTTHALRKVYGNYSYQVYAEQARVTKIAWLNKVLGHKPSSFSTALHYNTASFLDAAPKHQDYGDKNVIIADIKRYTEEAKEINDTLSLWRKEDVVANVTRIIQNLAGKRPLMIDKRSDADNLGKVPFVTKKRKIIYLDPVQRSGISHTERQQRFVETRDTFTTHNISHSYDNYNRLGFSSSYIAKQKKQRV